MAGPNDFHGEMINGVWTAMPGLGEDEPKVAGAAPLPEPPKVQELRKKAAELDSIEQRLAAREAELNARELALTAAQDA